MTKFIADTFGENDDQPRIAVTDSRNNTYTAVNSDFSYEAEKLFQLPISGNWIKLSEVTHICAFAADFNSLAKAVVYFSGTYNTTNIPCSSYEEACQIRDQIAGCVNDFLEKHGGN